MLLYMIFILRGASMKYIGVDIGGTNLVSAIVEKDSKGYKIICKKSCPTNVPRPKENICEDIIKITLEALKEVKLPLDEIKSIGIGVPGSVDVKAGNINFATNLFIENWNIKKDIEEKINDSNYLKKFGFEPSENYIEVFIENDANAAALGEALAGAAKGFNNAIMVTLGTGIGGGIIINKKIYSGANFAAGEIGHMVIVKDGIECTCGRKGCFERYASATGLINLTQQKMQENKDSKMWEIAPNLNEVNGKTAFDAEKLADKAAKQVLEDYIAYLGCGVANLINIFQPDCIIIGGGISNQGENLLSPLRKYIDKQTYNKNLKVQTRILKAQLANDAGVIGAAMLGE